jgi:hypothetical protein
MRLAAHARLTVKKEEDYEERDPAADLRRATSKLSRSLWAGLIGVELAPGAAAAAAAEVAAETPLCCWPVKYRV